MTKLLAPLFFALVASVPIAHLRWEKSDAVAEAFFTWILRAGPSALGWWSRTVATARMWAAAAVDPQVDPVLTPELAMHTAAARPAALPAPAYRVAHAVAAALGSIVDRAELEFVHRWPVHGHARVAASLFTASLALACSGVVGAATMVSPPSAVRPPAAGAADVAAPASPAVEAASVPAPASPSQPAPAAAAAEPRPRASAPPAPAGPAAAEVSTRRGALPIGKGMWIWLHDRAEGGDPDAIVARAKAWGFTHLYVRTGTLRDGFMAGPFLDRLLPVAHAAGIRVYGWDFPYMNHPGRDVERAVAAIKHTTPDGHRIDGFAPDIESKHEGTNESIEFVTAYVTWLRQNVGADYPLIAVVPNPTPGLVARGYPFAQIVAPFDAIAPMVYWMNREPGADVANAITYLSQFGKPIFPVGQAYDGGIDGGPAGVPNRDAIIRFMQVADQLGAAGVSFWSWQHATTEAWDAIRDAMEFRLGHGPPDALRPGMIRAYQIELTQLGFPVAVTGQWTPEMVAAVKAFQRGIGLAETGAIDPPTRTALLAPVAATIRPAGH